MKIKIKTTYRRSSDNYIQRLCDRIVAGLKGNAKFPDAEANRVKLETKVNEFRVAATVAGRNDRILSSAKNDIKAELVTILDQLADYVTATSNGDKTMLLSSGFDITGLKDESQVLQPIGTFTVESETQGQAITRVSRVTGARAYVYQYTTDPLTPNSVWVSETATDREHTFNGLQSIAKYWFRVIAVGRNKQTVYSPPVGRVIQ